MAAIKGKSGLMAKFGARLDKAVKAHAGDEVKTRGGGDPPPGIRNGIAKLVEVKIDQYKTGDNKGEYYFRAAGVIVSPDSVEVGGEKVPCKGLQTSIMIGILDRKDKSGQVTRSLEDAVDEVMNEMRKMGVDTNGMDGGSLEAMCDALKESGPYFRFRTSSKKDRNDPNKTDGVWQNWDGSKGLEEYSPDADAGGVEDETNESADAGGLAETADTTEEVAEEPEPEPESAPAAGPVKAKPTAGKPGAKPAVKAKTPPKEKTIEEWAEEADAGDEAAQTELTNRAYEAGLSDEDISSADNWADIVTKIQGGDEEAETDAEPTEDAPAAPEKGDIVFYLFTDPATKKKKKLECQVLAVNSKAETADLKNTDPPKQTIKWVSFDKLLSE